MASCKFDGGKCHGSGDVKAALRHNDCEPTMRAVAAKGNPDIDLAKASLNVRLWGGSYAERSAAYDRRIEQLDSLPGANLRKDRVTGQLIETPVPVGLPRDRYNDWMRRVVEIQVAKYGEDNVIAADGHWDEEHSYTGEDGQAVMSRVHVQTVVVPEVAGRLCGKEFYSRKAMRELNDAVEAMSISEFGVRFLDGTKKKGNKSTEQLKAESVRKATEAAQEAAKAIEDAARVTAARTLEAARRAAEEHLAAAEADAANIRRDADADRQEAAKILEDARHERALARVASKTAAWDKAQAQKDLTAAQVTVRERQLLDAAKRTPLKGQGTMYDFLARKIRAESIQAPAPQDDQQQQTLSDRQA